MRSRRTAITALAATALLLGACANDRPQTAGPGPDLDVQLVAALQPFSACDDFLDHVKREALEQVTPYGLGGGYYGMPVPMAAEDAAATRGGDGDAGTDVAASAPAEKSASNESPATTAAAMQADAASGAAATGTNNQEAGVDEADLVKVDGDRIVTVRGNQLKIVSLVGGAPYLTATVPLGDNFSGDRLFLLPDRAYVLGWDAGPPVGAATGRGTSDIGYYQPQQASVVEVALGDAPAVSHRVLLDGNILDGRMTNGALRLVLTSAGGTDLGFVSPNGSDTRWYDRALNANRDAINESQLEDWLPSMRLDGGDEQQLLACDHLYRPAESSGLSMLSILTIADGLGSLTGTGILSDGQTTYASTSHLYVTTNQWVQPDLDLPDGAVAKRAPAAADEHTAIHSFSIAGTAPAAYEASGRVDGHLLNQYSMSESGDDLRVATTSSGVGTWECPPNADCAVPPSTGESRVVVLRRRGEALEQIGAVDGLGPSEQIKSVRFTGDTAYVVTFRQTDPFYVVDLSDPTAPEVLGELKIPGFSSYLHPVGDHLVLGVGSNATDEGRITGAKLSLFDTGDPAAPKEVATWTTRDLAFMVDGDPHAFHWDAERSTAYLPYSGSCWDICNTAMSNGVLVVKVADGTITELGRITHEDRTASPPMPTEPVATTTTAVPETTVPETTVPETTVPVTSSGSASSGSTGVAASPPIGDVICDPSFCDPGPIGPWAPFINRVFVVGDRVITLSDAGVAAHDVANLRLTGFAAF